MTVLFKTGRQKLNVRFVKHIITAQ